MFELLDYVLEMKRKSTEMMLDYQKMEDVYLEQEREFEDLKVIKLFSLDVGRIYLLMGICIDGTFVFVV